jgi:quercetin dioxygenase-like cupin family protein
MRSIFLAGLTLAALPLGGCATGPVEVHNLGAQAPQQLSPGMTRRYASGTKSTLAIYELRRGTRVAMHYHDSEQVTYVQTGRLRFVVEGQTYNIGPGQMIVIPQYSQHSIEALENTVEYDFFSPSRHKWTEDRDESGPLPRD